MEEGAGVVKRRERVRRGVRVAWLALLLLYHHTYWAGTFEVGKREGVKLLCEKLLLTERQVRNLLRIMHQSGYIEPVASVSAVTGFRLTRKGVEEVRRLLGGEG